LLIAFKIFLVSFSLIRDGVPPPKYIELIFSFNSSALKYISFTIESIIESFDFKEVEK
jgi:hypothetical protein|tara:strand:+ start:105 stop:278 length:174 start_codon:yes stop_codon:yes gene_type:complete